eukprot:UC4_evm4s846
MHLMFQYFCGSLLHVCIVVGLLHGQCYAMGGLINFENTSASLTFKRNLETLSPYHPSCALHLKTILGSKRQNGTIHWNDVIKNPPENCEADMHCTSVLSPCCLYTLMDMFTWCLEKMNQHKITYFISEGSLVGALRNGGMPYCHYDIELHILYTDTDAHKDALKFAAFLEEVRQEPLLKVQGHLDGSNNIISAYGWHIDLKKFRRDVVRAKPMNSSQGWKIYPHFASAALKTGVAIQNISYGAVTQSQNSGEYYMFDMLECTGTCTEGITRWTGLGSRLNDVTTVSEDVLFPMRKCNFYGLSISCPQKIKKWNDITIAGGNKFLWLPSYVPIRHITENTLRENQKTNSFFDHMKTPSKFGHCVRENWITPLALRKIHEKIVPQLIQSMICLRKHGFTTLFDQGGSALFLSEHERNILNTVGFPLNRFISNTDVCQQMSDRYQVNHKIRFWGSLPESLKNKWLEFQCKTSPK